MSQQPFGDIPLFRELQKLLAAGEGPINIEIARQVANAVGTGGMSDTDTDQGDLSAMSAGVHTAEQLVASYSRLPFVEPAVVKLMGRGEWISRTLTDWKWLFEPLALRFTAELSKLGGEPPAESSSGASNPMGQVMQQVGPLMLGLQVGTLVGHLAREVVSRYDLPIPRDDDGALHFVWPNVRELEESYGFDEAGFRAWLSLRDAARRHVLNATPWIERYFRSLLLEIVDALEIDPGDLERRLMEMQTRGVEAMEIDVDEVLPIAQTERHRNALARLQAFVAIVEGYATHVSSAVAGELVEDRARIDEGMARHNASPSEGKAMLASVLGLSFDRSLQAAGETFCAAVVKLHGLGSLNSVWVAPDNLPTLGEVRDPFTWIERVLVDVER